MVRLFRAIGLCCGFEWQEIIKPFDLTTGQGKFMKFNKTGLQKFMKFNKTGLQKFNMVISRAMTEL